MLTVLQKLIALLFKQKQEHKHEIIVVDEEKIQLRKEIASLKVSLSTSTASLREYKDAAHQADLWMKKSAQLQEKLSAALGHTTVLEGVLEESNRTIDSLQLAIELREKEETEGLQNYIDELEDEIDVAIALITKYGLQLRKG